MSPLTVIGHAGGGDGGVFHQITSSAVQACRIYRLSQSNYYAILFRLDNHSPSTSQFRTAASSNPTHHTTNTTFNSTDLQKHLYCSHITIPVVTPHITIAAVTPHNTITVLTPHNTITVLTPHVAIAVLTPHTTIAVLTPRCETFLCILPAVEECSSRKFNVAGRRKDEGGIYPR